MIRLSKQLLTFCIAVPIDLSEILRKVKVFERNREAQGSVEKTVNGPETEN